jgi:uncharacterized protein (TIGR00369 family)
MAEFLMRGRRVPIAETLGAELLEHGEGRSRIRYPILPQYMNPAGQLQGGMFAVMLDTAMAIAADGIATAAMQFSILRPVTGGHVIATGEVVRAGRNLVYAEAELRDEATGALLARGNQTGLPRNVFGRPEGEEPTGEGVRG